eukprot:scaffold707376_cov122-Attheya_sp.AAC.1
MNELEPHNTKRQRTVNDISGGDAIPRVVHNPYARAHMGVELHKDRVPQRVVVQNPYIRVPAVAVPAVAPSPDPAHNQNARASRVMESHEEDRLPRVAIRNPYNRVPADMPQPDPAEANPFSIACRETQPIEK